MVRELKHHPGFYLEDAAAADFDRMEDEQGVFNVTSARRSEDEQQKLIDAWDRGGVYNRPPYLFNPYRPARLGPHVKNGGIAVDVTDWQRLMRVMSNYHFTHPYDWDVVHFEHDGNRDTLNQEGNMNADQERKLNERLDAQSKQIADLSTNLAKISEVLLNGRPTDLTTPGIIAGIDAAVETRNRLILRDPKTGTTWDVFQEIVPRIRRIDAALSGVAPVSAGANVVVTAGMAARAESLANESGAEA